MSDHHQPPRESATVRGEGIVAASANALNRIVNVLATAPTLLVVVLLNVAMIGTAGWFLNAQESMRHRTLAKLLEVVAACVTTHERERR